MFKETGLCSWNILLYSCLRLLCNTQMKTSVVGRLWGNIPFPRDFYFYDKETIQTNDRRQLGDVSASLREETFLVSEEFVSNMQLRWCSDVYFTLVLTRSLASELLKNKFECASTKPALPVCTRTPTRGCCGRISQKSKTDDWWGLSMITLPASPRARTCLDISAKLSLDSHTPTGSWSMKNPCEFFTSQPDSAERLS